MIAHNIDDRVNASQLYMNTILKTYKNLLQDKMNQQALAK